MDIKSIILTIAGVAILGSFYKIIIPSGRTAKTVAFVVSLMMSIALLNPFLTLFNEKLIERQTSAYTTTDNLVEYELEFMKKYTEKSIKKHLLSNKIKADRINIDIMKKDQCYLVNKIYFYLGDLSYLGDDKNINISSLTKSIISEKFNVAEGDIVIYE